MGQRRPADLAVPSVPVGAGEARRWVRRQLEGWGFPEAVVDDAALVVSELVGNAVVHGRPDDRGCVRVALDPLDGQVRLEVTDGGADRLPRLRHEPDVSLTGRGLRIVASLAADWGFREDRSGVTVWAVLPAPRRSSESL